MADGCKVWHPHNTTSSSGGSEDKSVGKQVMCASDPSPPQQTMERKKTQVWDNRQLGIQSNPDTVWVPVHHDMGEVGVQVLDRCHLGGNQTQARFGTPLSRQAHLLATLVLHPPTLVPPGPTLFPPQCSLVHLHPSLVPFQVSLVLPY
ncbi:hypothetical protein HanRHA438_Chr16g0754371 [Helianthus annuus]|nr:hypothetical protein HanIR_Chr16g0807201 [Helianthus annuus]KAJ0835365.1 hypothetical protein HanRHA438_Chr16g0754371 [Helianthus annuus]